MTTYVITTMAQCVFRSLSWLAPCKHLFPLQDFLPLQHCLQIHFLQATKRENVPVETILLFLF
jgi:hypothetical protein